MKRLVILPAVAALCVAEAWRKGIVWPVVTTFYRCFAARPETAETEYDRAG